MKQISILLIFLLSLPLFGQEIQKDKKIQVEVGLVFHKNDLNEDNYLNNKSPWGLSSDRLMAGADLRFTVPSKLDFIDFTFGTIIENCWDEYDATTDYKLNGGGVYAGISPKFKSKFFGFTSLLSVGVFSYKEYFAFYRESPLPVIDIYEKKASFGFGAMSSIGIYGKIGPVGIHPQAQAIFTGGNNASFLFYGFVIPLTIQF
jgi:hypothetical protein